MYREHCRDECIQQVKADQIRSDQIGSFVAFTNNPQYSDVPLCSALISYISVSLAPVCISAARFRRYELCPCEQHGRWHSSLACTRLTPDCNFGNFARQALRDASHVASLESVFADTLNRMLKPQQNSSILNKSWFKSLITSAGTWVATFHLIVGRSPRAENSREIREETDSGRRSTTSGKCNAHSIRYPEGSEAD